MKLEAFLVAPGVDVSFSIWMIYPYLILHHFWDLNYVSYAYNEDLGLFCLDRVWWLEAQEEELDQTRDACLLSRIKYVHP